MFVIDQTEMERCLNKPRIELEEENLIWSPLVSWESPVFEEDTDIYNVLFEPEDNEDNDPNKNGSNMGKVSILNAPGSALKKKRRRRWYKAYNNQKRRRKSQHFSKTIPNKSEGEPKSPSVVDEDDLSQFLSMEEQETDDDDDDDEGHTDESDDEDSTLYSFNGVKLENGHKDNDREINFESIKNVSKKLNFDNTSNENSCDTNSGTNNVSESTKGETCLSSETQKQLKIRIKPTPILPPSTIDENSIENGIYSLNSKRTRSSTRTCTIASMSSAAMSNSKRVRRSESKEHMNFIGNSDQMVTEIARGSPHSSNELGKSSPTLLTNGEHDRSTCDFENSLSAASSSPAASDCSSTYELENSSPNRSSSDENNENKLFIERDQSDSKQSKLIAEVEQSESLHCSTITNNHNNSKHTHRTLLTNGDLKIS